MKKIILMGAAMAALSIAPSASAEPQIADLLKGAASTMLGGGTQENAQQQQLQQQQQQQQQGGLGSMLGGLLGGGAQQQQQQPQQQQQQQQQGGMGSMLGGLLGGGAQQQQQQQQQGGSGDVLGGLLGGLAGGLTGGSADGGSSTGSSLMSGLGGLLEGVLSTSKLTEADLVGTWAYVSPAVAFQSENFLQKAGGAAAAGVIENKLAPYYQKVGLNNLEATFNTDQTFVFKMRRGALSGTYQLKPDSEMPGVFIFTFTVAGTIPLGSFEAYVEKVGNKISIEFDATRLIAIVNAVAQVSRQSTLQTVASMLNSYDGLLCGFQLQKKGARY